MRRLLCKLRKLDPRKVDPTRGHVWADASVVAVLVLDVMREAATVFAPVVVVIVFAVYWAIEVDN